MEIYFENKKVKWLNILYGYCPFENKPCSQCSYFNEEEYRCTHEPFCVNLLMELEDGSEVTITLPLEREEEEEE